MTAVGLPVMPPIARERYGVLARRVRPLSWLSLAWMTVEGAVAIVAGIAASSIALIGFGLFVLAPYVAFESVRTLAAAEHPEVTWVGIGLATGSVILMPMLGIAKQRLADQLGSVATRGEGRQAVLCAYLAGALLIGLLGNALAGAWWLDPAVGLLIAGVAVREGIESWRGEGCCVASPLDGARFADDDCRDECGDA